MQLAEEPQEERCDWFKWSCFYFGVAIVTAALFVAVIVTTAKYSMAVNLGIWIGGMGGFLVALFLIGYNVERYNYRYRVSDDCGFFTIFTVLNVATFGLTIGFLFAGPWLYMVDHGTARNVHADGRGADLFGLFFFNESAFVDSRFVGVSQAISRGSVTSRYCVAPIKSSLSQVDVIYWAVAYDCCRPDHSQTCWPAVTANQTSTNTVVSSPALTGTVGLEQDNSLFVSTFLDKALGDALVTWPSQVKVGVSAGVQVSSAVQARLKDDKLPVWVSLRANPEAFRDQRGQIGIIWMALSAALWPLALALLCSWAILLTLLCPKKQREMGTLHQSPVALTATTTQPGSREIEPVGASFNQSSAQASSSHESSHSAAIDLVVESSGVRSQDVALAEFRSTTAPDSVIFAQPLIDSAPISSTSTQFAAATYEPAVPFQSSTVPPSISALSSPNFGVSTSSSFL